MSQAAKSPRFTRAKVIKAAVWTVVIAIAVVVLFTTVFPWVEERQQDPTLGAPITEPVVVATSPVSVPASNIDVQFARSPR